MIQETCQIMNLSQEESSNVSARTEQLRKALLNDQVSYLVIPSVSLPPEEIAFIQRAVVEYEGRLQWLLARSLTRHVVYVSSAPVSPASLGHLLHCANEAGTNVRMETICLEDTSSIPLTDKILARKDWLERIRKAVSPTTVLVPFIGTQSEFELADLLGIPVAAASPELSYLGSKSGSRKIFRAAGIRLPLGFEDLFSGAEIINALDRLWTAKPTLKKAVVKLNSGVSGYGNGICSMPGDPTGLSREERLSRIEGALEDIRFETPMMSSESFLSRFAQIGGIVEEFLEGDQKLSPSGQAFIHPDGKVELLSTHDQILSGMVYKGALFPATSADAVQSATQKVGEELAREGAVCYYAVDFMEVDGTLYAIEINLRQGGTTHLRAAAMLGTASIYEPAHHCLVSSRGKKVYYAGTDSFSHPRLKTKTPAEIIEYFWDKQLIFYPTRGTGVRFHLLDTVGRSGNLGYTAIDSSRELAQDLFHRVHDELLRLLDPE